MIGHDHDTDGEERGSGIVRPPKDEANNAAGDAGKSADFEQHVLIENAAPQRLIRHAQNVVADAKNEGERHAGHDPRRGVGKPRLTSKRNQTRCNGGEQQGAADRDAKAARAQHQENEGEQAGDHCRRQERGGNADRVRNERDRDQAECRCYQKPAAFAHEIPLFLLERTDLARI